MTTINPVQTPVAQAPAFRGKNKKTMEVIDKLAFQLPQEAIKQAAFKDIRKTVAEDAYAAAHKTAAEMIDRIAVNPYEFCMPKHDKAKMKELAELNFLEQCRAKIDEFLINRLAKKLNQDIKNVELK